ncbi:MAG: MFS transporter [Synergistaceae bacterium]|nr:MFS transporter [Synergistaceae bacterium]
MSVTASKASVSKIAWSSWGIIAFSYFLACIHRTVVGTASDEICRDFALSRTAFGVMSSMYFYAYMVMQIPAGLLADNIGPRKTVAAGALVGGAATFMFGLASGHAMLFAARFLIGAGMATAFVCLLKIQSQWFPDKMFATLSGFSIFMGNIGNLMGQLPFALLTLHVGWQNSYLMIAVITAMSGAACYFLIRNKPEDAGLPPVNPQNAARECKIGLIEGVKAVMRERRTYGAIIFYVFNQTAFISFVGAWLVPWLREVHGMSSAAAANFGMLAIIGGMAGSSLSGLISDKLKLRKPAIIAGAVIYTCAWGTMAFWNTGDHFHIGALLFALGLGTGVFPLSMAIVKEVSLPSLTGTAVSVLNTVGFLGMALGTSLLGLIADLGENLSQAARFGNVLFACFAAAVVSLIAALCCYETHARNASFPKL